MAVFQMESLGGTGRTVVGAKFCSLQIEGKGGQPFDSGGGHQVVLFQADARIEIAAIDAWLDGDDIADLELVVVTGIEPGDFMRIQSDAVA